MAKAVGFRGARTAGLVLWCGVVAALTAAMWSDRMSAWWGDQSSGDAPPAVPAPLQPAVSTVLDARPSTSEADVHVLLWGGVAVLLMVVLRGAGLRARLLALGGLFGYSVLVEALQPVASSRSASWGDVVGNAIGIGLVAVAVGLWPRLRPALRPAR